MDRLPTSGNSPDWLTVQPKWAPLPTSLEGVQTAHSAHFASESGNPSPAPRFVVDVDMTDTAGRLIHWPGRSDDTITGTATVPLSPVFAARVPAVLVFQRRSGPADRWVDHDELLAICRRKIERPKPV